MTVEHDQTGAAAGTVPAAGESTAGRVADTARTEASNVASTAAGGAREVADEAGAQAKAVASEAKQQLDRLVSQSREEFRQQAEQRSSQAAGQLRTLSEQFSALVAGRPEAAGPLVGYVSDLQGQLKRLASRMEQGGPQGVVDDVTRLARRRPGAFLAGAAGIGFVVGRLVRAGAASQRDDGPSTGDASPTAPNGPGFVERSPLPPPVHSAGSAP
jgi:BMFP domain-containing protein YqiC